MTVEQLIKRLHTMTKRASVFMQITISPGFYDDRGQYANATLKRVDHDSYSRWVGLTG